MAFGARRSIAGRHCCFRSIYLGAAGSQVKECAAISNGCLFHPSGATFTYEFLSVATCSQAKRDGNASVVGAYCFVIQVGVEINSSDVTVTCGEPWCLLLLMTACGSTWYKACCPNKRDKISRRTLAIGFGGKQDADITKAKPKDESMLKSDVIIIFIAGRLFKTVFKGHLTREKSGLAVKHEPTPSSKFCKMLKVEFLDNSRMPHKQTLKFMKDDMILPAYHGGSSNGRKKTLTDVPRMQPPLAKKIVKSDCLDDKKMVFKVPRVKQSLVSSKVDVKLGISGSLLHSTKAGIPLLRACWLWLFLFVILLSASGVNAAEDHPSSKQGNCRYDLTSVATLSCVQPNSPWQTPSKTCCKALLYAIDLVPPSGESGACCLCRYMRAKHPSSKLVRAYVSCKGKDSCTVAKRSSFPIVTCSTACKKRSNSSRLEKQFGASADKDRPVVHGTSNGIFFGWVAAGAAVVLMGLICFWYFWRFKPAVKASEQRRRLLQEGDPRGGRRQSSARSSAQLKGRRITTSRSSPNS